MAYCGFCGHDGPLRVTTRTERFEHRGVTLGVSGYVYSVCEACKAQIVTAEQMKSNQRRVEDARRRADEFMDRPRARRHERPAKSP